MHLGLTNEELATLPTTQYRFVLVTRLIVITGMAALVAFGHAVYADHNQMALDILNAWLLFLAGLAGLNVAQYGVKRATDADAKAKVEAAKQPQQVATAAPGGTVVQAAPPSTVTAEHATVQVAGRPVAGPPDEHEWAVGDPKAGLL